MARLRRGDSGDNAQTRLVGMPAGCRWNHERRMNLHSPSQHSVSECHTWYLVFSYECNNTLCILFTYRNQYIWATVGHTKKYGPAESFLACSDSSEAWHWACKDTFSTIRNITHLSKISKFQKPSLHDLIRFMVKRMRPIYQAMSEKHRLSEHRFCPNIGPVTVAESQSPRCPRCSQMLRSSRDIWLDVCVWPDKGALLISWLAAHFRKAVYVRFPQSKKSGNTRTD